MDKDNQKEEKQNLSEIFNNLPKIIQDAITKSGWEREIRYIVKRYKLRIDQETQLENMTFALMMGQLDPKEYYNSIMNEFGLEKEVAETMFQEIDEKVFANISRMITRLDAEEQLKESAPEKATGVRDDVESASEPDEILTVTRDEILKDIENPERIKEKKPLPDLQEKQTMPQAQVPAKKEQAPQNVPTSMPKKEEPKGPVDPVKAGMGNNISTSSKNYKGVDPYREPIE
jgi:hypothetical protein